MELTNGNFDDCIKEHSRLQSSSLLRMVYDVVTEPSGPGVCGISP